MAEPGITILSVDDEPDLEMLLSQKFRNQIKAGEYIFRFAEDGVQALDLLKNGLDADIILCDINMPRMDGLSMLEALKHLDKKWIRTVMVSAYGDMKNIRQAMNLGAFDFVVKPIDFSDLHATLIKAITELEQLKAAEKSQEELKMVKYDLEAASVIQRALIPNQFPAFKNIPEIEVFGRMDTAGEVGGDFYDFFRIDEDRVGLVIADVSGKGAQAAIYMAVSKTVLRTIATQVAHPAECLHRVNQNLIPESTMNSFVTIWYGVLNRKTGVLQYANGGHNLPYVKKADGSVITLENTDGMLIGKFGFADYDAKKINMEKGDTLILYTDRIPEAMNNNMDEFSDERFVKLIQNLNPSDGLEDFLSIIYDAVHDHTDGYLQSDDITMLLARYL